MRIDSTRLEHRVISELIEERSSILDLGCGNGELLSILIKEKNVNAQGIEIDGPSIHKCVAQGLSVFQQNIDTGLSEYGEKFFDYVILSQSLQQVKSPDYVLREALRVGKKVIVSFPNFAHYTARFQIFFAGRVPVTRALPYEWHNSPNVHFLSISDFFKYCRERRIQIAKSVFVGKNTRVRLMPNLFAEIGIFLLKENRNK